MSFIDFRLLTTMRVYRNEDPIGYDKLEIAYGRGPFAFERFGHDNVWGDYIALTWDATAQAKKLALWLLMAAAVALFFALATDEAHAETDVLVFGASKHFQTNGHKYNEANVGLGAEWRPAADSPWFVGGFALRDSLYRTGYAAYGGYRLRHEFGNGWHAEASLRAGYLKDANYAGPAALPSLGFGYKNVTLEATYLPKIGNNKTPVAVIWLRVGF